MSTPSDQPGLNSLSKSFEPAALEAHWGPEWEKRGYGVAGFRGTSAPSAEAAAVASSSSARRQRWEIAPALVVRVTLVSPPVSPPISGCTSSTLVAAGITGETLEYVT
jgi:hypothetical protein